MSLLIYSEIMQIKSYQDASKIENKYLPQLAERQAECWWAKPFDEYRICKNDSCKAIFSIEEVLWNILEIRNITSWKIDFSCSECTADTKEMYPKEKFIDMMKQYFLWEVSWVLVVDESDTVEWFWFTSKTTIRSLMEFEFNTRPSSYHIEDTIKKMWEALYGSEDVDQGEVICFHQIYLSPLIRESKLSYSVLKALLEIHRDDYRDIPIVWESKYDNKFYPILRSMGVQNLASDKYWYVIQTLARYSDMLDFLDIHSGYQDFLWDMIRYKKDSRRILKDSPELTKRKFYI